MTKPIKLLPLILGFLLLVNCQQNKELAPNSPNFLVIIADDLDYSEISCYGGEIPTPTIDQLAETGIQFTNFYTSNQDTKTRSMLLTGTSQGQVPSTHQLQTNAMTIADLLKTAGYRTFMSGKWNLGKERADLPTEKGFERSFALMDEVCNHLGNKRYFPAMFKEGNNIEEISEDFYTTQYFSRKLLSFLSSGKKKQQQKPFFAYLSFTAPHYPLQAPARSIQNFKNQYSEGYKATYEQRLTNQLALGIHSEVAEHNLPDWADLSMENQAYEARKMEIYAAMVNDMDTHIGRIIDYLKVSEQYDNTVIIFLSDSGITIPKNNQQFNDIDNSIANLGNANSLVDLGKNWTSIKYGDKANKIAAFDQAIKAPLIISSPLLKEANGSLDDKLRTVMDITPTILNLLDLPHPSESYFEDVISMEGKSIF